MRKLIVLILFPFTVLSQTNLVDSSSWSVGSGAEPGFNIMGDTNENLREYGTGPDGTTVLLWTSLPSGNGDYDGGWKTDVLPIDSSKSYMFTVWIKKTGSNNGNTYFAFTAYDSSYNYSGTSLDGSITNTGTLRFFHNDLPTLDEWYLLVAFVHDTNYGSTSHSGRIYDTLGNEVAQLNDFKFTSNSQYIRHRVFLYNDSTTSDRQYYWAPGLYEMDGQEPSVSDLLGLPSGDAVAPSSPILAIDSYTDTTVDVSWSGATDNMAVTGYKLFKDGVLEATLGAVNTYQINGLIPSTSYDLSIRAMDAAANESPISNTATVTTNSTSSGSGNTESVWTESGSIASYNGQVTIGTMPLPLGYSLAIDGKVIAEEVRVQLSGSWPDYVFSTDYELQSLEEIKKYIEENGHLPNIPSAKKVKQNGLELAEMNRMLLEKIEELTLYAIQLNENHKKQITINEELQGKIRMLEKRIDEKL